MKINFIFLVCISATALSSGSNGSENSNSEGVSEYNRHVKPLIQKYCIDCHGPEKDKGDVRFDNLDPDIVSGEDGFIWVDALDQINSGEMPPKKEEQPTLQEHKVITQWLDGQLKKAISARKALVKEPALRRMTRYELSYALEDLLRFQVDVEDLPEEAVSEATGMKNAAGTLTLGGPQLEAYMEIVLKAVGGIESRLNDEITVEGLPQILADRPKPKAPKSPAPTLSGAQKKQAAAAKKKLAALKKADSARKSAAAAERARFELKLNDARLVEAKRRAALTPEQRRMDDIKRRKAVAAQKVAARAVEAKRMAKLSPAEQKADLQVKLAGKEKQRQNKVARDAVKRKAREAEQRLKEISKNLTPHEDGFLLKKGGVVIFRINSLKSRGGEFVLQLKSKASIDTTLAVSVGYIVSGITMYQKPLGDLHVGSGDLRTYTIKGNLESIPKRFEENLVFWITSKTDSSEVYVESCKFSGPLKEAYQAKLFDGARDPATLINHFAQTAFRRPLDKDESEALFRVYESRLAEEKDMTKALIHTFSRILCSPKFLYLGRQSAGSDFRLAEKLSFFLWCSIPDRELYQLAESGVLQQPDVLKAQISRMLRDERSKRLVENFSDQWLETGKLFSVAVDNSFYKDFSREVHMPLLRQETIESVNDVFRSEASALDLLKSDYIFVNDILADHYGIKGVEGGHFRKVKLSPGSVRGGLLTQAAFLVSNSDGKNSHAIKRGIWVLDRILNDPPSPPPNNVPDLDDTIPGFELMSLNEKLARHSEDVRCAGCHEKIDPWGLLFEGFDASGSFRSKVLIKPSVNSRTPALFAEVDSESTLLTGDVLDGTQDLKDYLVQEKREQFAKSLTERLLSYALSRDVNIYDRELVAELSSHFVNSDYSVQKLIEAIVACETFKKTNQ